MKQSTKALIAVLGVGAIGGTIWYFTREDEPAKGPGTEPVEDPKDPVPTDDPPDPLDPPFYDPDKGQGFNPETDTRLAAGDDVNITIPPAKPDRIWVELPEGEYVMHVEGEDVDATVAEEPTRIRIPEKPGEGRTWVRWHLGSLGDMDLVHTDEDSGQFYVVRLHVKEGPEAEVFVPSGTQQEQLDLG